jgi:hypothetical protein
VMGLPMMTSGVVNAKRQRGLLVADTHKCQHLLSERHHSNAEVSRKSLSV